MVVIKFCVKEQTNPLKSFYRWEYSKPIGTIKFYDVLRKLNELTNSKFVRFVLKWSDGVDLVMITDTRSLQDAIRELSLKNTKDKCARIEVTAYTETNINDPPPSYEFTTSASTSSSIPTKSTSSVSKLKKVSAKYSYSDFNFNPSSHNS